MDQVALEVWHWHVLDDGGPRRACCSKMTYLAEPRHRRGILLAIIAGGALLFAPADWVARAAEQAPVPRVFVHYSRASEQGRQVAAEVALYLAGRGYQVADIREIPFAVSAARLRYFFASDRKPAEQIAAHVNRYLTRATDANGRAQVQDYTRYQPLPARSNIEVWGLASETAFQTRQ